MEGPLCKSKELNSDAKNKVLSKNEATPQSSQKEKGQKR
jgi:hypothetical protein